MAFRYLTIAPDCDHAALRRVAALVRRPLDDVARAARAGTPVLAVHDADGEDAAMRLRRAGRILEAHGVPVATAESATFRP